LPTRVAIAVKLPEKRRFQRWRVGGRTSKYREGGWASKQRLLNAGKLNSSRRVAKESFSPNHYNVLFDIKRNTVIITNNKPTIL